MRRPLAVAIVLCSAGASALEVGNGSVIATPEVTITKTAGAGGSGTATVTNTTSSSIGVTVAPDVSCDPDIGLVVAGGDTFTLAANGMKPIGFPCSASQPPGMERCLVHATDASGNPLVDLIGVCEQAASGTLVPAPTSLPFGTVAVGDTSTMPVVLTNTSATTISKLFLQTDDINGDFQLSAPCNPDAAACDGAIPALAPNASATVLVTCAPRSAGVHAANLEIATDTAQRLSQSIALTCTGGVAVAPVLGYSPDTVAVQAPVEVVSAQAHTIVRLANLGTGTLLLTDIRVVDVVAGAAADWTFTISGTCTSTPCSLAAGAEVAVNVTFDPSAIARRDASLLISFHDTNDRTHSLPLSGVGQGATLEGLALGTLDFGEVPTGRTSSLSFQLVNRGNRDTTAMLSTAPPGAIATTDNTVTVSPTAASTVMTTCAPTVAGVASAMITAQSTDTITTTPVIVAATCNGITTPLFATPTAIALGELRVGDAPLTIPLTIASTGTQLTFSGPAAFDQPNANLTVDALSAGTTPATVDVTLTPTATGQFTSHLVVADTAGDTLRIPITATVVTPSYTVPPTVDVGTFCVGQPTASASVALQVDGAATLEVAAPSLPTTSAFQLAFTAPTVYPASLAANDTAIVAVTPERQSTATTLTDTLTWATDESALPISTSTITAEFVGSGGAIAPSSINFGNVPVHLFIDDGQRVEIQNCDTSELDFNPPTIQAPFYADSPPPTQLLPNETGTFVIGFHPTSLGVFQETVSITPSGSGAQPLEVHVVGTSVSTTPPQMDAGISNAAPGTTDFYACSCASHDPRSGWPIVLVLALVICRRRSESS